MENIWQLLNQVSKKGEEEEKGEEKEKEAQPQQQPQPQAQIQQQVIQQQQQQQFQEALKTHILEARIRFLRDYPEAEAYMNQVFQVAYSTLVGDYQQGKLRSDDFYDYLVSAWEGYKEFVKRQAMDLARIERREIPPRRRRRGNEGNEEETLSKEEYYRWYAEEYLPSITKQGKFVEQQIWYQGQKIPRYIQGKDKWFESGNEFEVEEKRGKEG